MKKTINNNNMYILQHLLLGFVLGSEVVAVYSSLPIHSFSVMSDIKFRYATTRVETVFKNTKKSLALAEFYVNIPENAFISNFTMEVNGSVIVGEILEKEKAQEIYTKAVQRGETAAYVGTEEHRYTSVFKVMVSVEANKTAVFRLTYQELLRRTFGKYRHVIHLTNKQIIENFKIEVFITDLQSVNLSRPELKPDSLKLSDNGLVEAGQLKHVGNIDYISSKQVYIKYEPSTVDQKSFSDLGITGLFELEYDVDWKQSPNMIYAIDGYFVHFYAPDSFPLLRKNIVFMLDVSGSMEGNKIKQLKEAMDSILYSLKAEDKFLVGIFSSDVSWMDDGFLLANSENVNAALKYIDGLSANGGTNIYYALQSSLGKFTKSDSSNTKNLIFFLTDGQPTNGIRNLNQIVRDVSEANNGISIFSLGFGGGSNMNFLKQLAVKNGGFSRKIYEAADSQMQILNLYQEISNILLKNIIIVYLDDAVNQTSLTENSFSYYFKGTEIVVAGVVSKQLKDDMKVLLTMNTFSGKESLTLKLPVDDLGEEFVSGYEGIPQNPKLTTLQSLHTITRNTWVHLTLKRLLSLERTPEIKQQIISISLKYGFVTPLTSMVAVQGRRNDIRERTSNNQGRKVYPALIESDGNISYFHFYLLLASTCFQRCFWN